MSPNQRHYLRSEANPSESTHTAQQLFYEVKRRILTSNGPGYFQYNVSDPSIGLLLSKSLDSNGEIERRSVHISYNSFTRILSIKTPIAFQNSHIAWAVREFALSLSSGFFTLQEFDAFIFSSDSTFENFLPPYENSLKQPDAYFRLPGSRHPTIVFEAGYSESYPQLICHRDIWINGTSDVNVVIILKWSLVQSGTIVEGFLAVWRRNSLTCQRFEIFPAPPLGVPAQEITLYRGDFYPSGQVPFGRNASDIWQWPLDSLRTRGSPDDPGHPKG
ncbi:hypothetical protein C8Q69DRAFT_28530 [Paecilomyces variotii]|uniref:Uncharacterized protein n=1 Tax=Byssochlamys spectabilis TaxID=264951 RepID=A0A443I615_BYSSP|nr:hypothetical protein C8Q69DRAFT_28530 [Paecilomyces variotii]RWQ99528.1 hypothetical protein C8Q69DRAFT_28530 [Paecilomyces variotii]